MNTFNKLTLRWKLVLGFALPMILIVALSAVVYNSIGSLIKTAGWVEHTHEAIEHGNGLTASMINMETGLRGYLIAGKDAFLEPYEGGQTTFREIIEQAKLHVNDNPTQVKRLESVESMKNEWLQKHAEVAIAQRQEVIVGTASMLEVTAFIEQGIGKTYMDNIRGVLTEFTGEEQVLIGVRSEEAEVTAAFATTATLTGAVTAIILGFLLTFLITRNVLSQIGGEPQVVDDIARAIAEGKLNIEIDTQGKTPQGIFGSMVTMKEKLTEVVNEIMLSADSVKSGASEISQGNVTLSNRTEEQASSLEETASSMEEMTSTVKQNADNAGEANQLAKAARDQAEKGGKVVNEAVEAMAGISASSKKIADIIGVIDEIAFQTNLLALNASVEAARAGEQGRGFAVVASEVRNLAGRSATAAKEIKELIQDSVSKVEDGSRLVDESGQTLEEIVTSVKKVTDIIGEIAAASLEQSSGIEEVNKAIVQMDDLTQQNAALVEQASAASASMSEQANGLDELMRFFTVDAQSSARTTTQTAAVSVKPAGPPDGVEHRSAKRPWSGAKPVEQHAEHAQQESSEAPPLKQVANSGNDVAWEEF